MKYFLYRIDENADGVIYGCFDSLSAAKLSAKLLLIEDLSFILSGDVSRIYFYENHEWDYDYLDDVGKMEFLEMYPDPREYNFD